MPVELLRTGFGAGLTTVDTFSTNLSSWMSTLTFDKDYINKRQRERVNAKKTSHNLSTGLQVKMDAVVSVCVMDAVVCVCVTEVQAAARNVGEGVLSLANVVTKPIEGGRREGVQGFAKGFAQGLMGSIIKPVDKVRHIATRHIESFKLGQAVSNVVSGVKAEYVSKPLGVSKMVIKRRRKPRMLWGEHGQLRYAQDAQNSFTHWCKGTTTLVTLTFESFSACGSPKMFYNVLHSRRRSSRKRIWCWSSILNVWHSWI